MDRESFKNVQYDDDDRSDAMRILQPKHIEQSENIEQQEMLECQHDFLTMEGSCANCGMIISELNQDGSGYAVSRNSEKSILKEMDNFTLSDDVKLKAESIFGKLNPQTKRGNRRKQLIFFCIYSALLELGIPQDPKKIAQLVGIKTSEMTKALSMYSQSQTGYKPPLVFITPLNFIPQYCEALQLSPETIQDVLNFAQGILDKDPTLKEKFPQKIAAGILLYYLTINGIQVNKKEYAKMIQLSEVTINNIYKQILNLHNSN